MNLDKKNLINKDNYFIFKYSYENKIFSLNASKNADNIKLLLIIYV